MTAERLRIAIPAAMAAMIAAVAAIAFSGGGSGGGSDSKEQRGDGLAAALAVVPSDAPMVAVLETSATTAAGKAAATLLQRLPAVAQLAPSLGLELAPLRGNPLVVGAEDRSGHTVAALRVDDQDGLDEALAEATNGGRIRRAGSRGKAELYTVASGGSLAVEDGLVVGGSDAQVVRRALQRRKVAGLTPAAFAARLRGLPTAGALLRGAGDARVVEERLGRGFRELGWTQSLTDVVFAATPDAEGVRLRAQLRTDPSDLVESDVPIALGPQAPRPAGEAPTTIALRDATHTIAVLERALQAAGNKDYQRFDKFRDQLRTFGRIDLESLLLTQLTGTTTLTSDGGRVTVRAELRDGEGLRKLLPRLQPVSGLALSAAGLADYVLENEAPDVYRLARAGQPVVRFGVIAGVLAVTTAPDVDLAKVAARKPRAAKGAIGAFHGRIDGELLRSRIVGLLGLPEVAASALGPLGDLTISARGELTQVAVDARLQIR